MLRFRPSNITHSRNNINFNQLQLIALIEKGLSDNSLRGYLYKRSSPNAKWRLKWFLLFENLLFYFDVPSNEQQAQGQQQANAPANCGPGSGSGSTKSSASRTLSALIGRASGGSSNATKSGQSGQDSLEWKQLQAARQLQDTNRKVGGRRASFSDNPVLLDDDQELEDEREDLELFRRRYKTVGAGSLRAGAKRSSMAGSVGETSARSACLRTRQRLSSDPQQSRIETSQARDTISAAAAANPTSAATKGALTDSVSLNYELLSRELPLSSKTLNSSSISGVSGHFLAQNEQTIGRSTTTTAGKTPMASSLASSNYSSLLNRRIGVIFLEGSYCERLVDSGSFTGANNCLGPLLTSSKQNSPSNVGLESYGQQDQMQQLSSSVCNIKSASAASASNSLINDAIGGSNGRLGYEIAGEESEYNCIFTLTWKKEGSKEYEFRSETEAECLTWVHAISNARYSSLLNDKEQLEQKYLHLSQIIESESTAKWQYSKQCDELSAEIKKLRQEICLLKRQESRSNHLRLVLSKSAAIVETIMRQQRRRHRQQQHQRLGFNAGQTPNASSPSQNSPPLKPGQSPASYAGDEAKLEAEELALGQLEPLPASSLPELGAAALTGDRDAGSGPAQFILKRARSMDQEQEEQELAIRRARRRQACQQRHASQDQLISRRQSLGVGGAAKEPARDAGSGALGGPVEGGDGGGPAPIGESPECDADEAEERALSIEIRSVVEALNSGLLLSDCLLEVENSEEIRKIKKVQGFFRGWLCRRRWKQIVQEYIKSPHAESMRRRNNLVFRMVECEEEYVEQLTLLIAAFLRPIKMAASSQRPALSHDELNSIFLNSETLLFLHQIFLKGLTARMESWPTLVLGDLFTMLLPMLTIYQEYVRNHHFSLQVLAECKQRQQFSQILRRLEEKPQLNGRTLETFLTYPMHQIPRYIICLHEILAHTPHNHVERKSLYEAQTKLEELSRQMHDEVSETENIRQNLAIERMIIGGCDILLDVNQVFIRQGILVQVIEQPAKGGKSRSRLASFAGRHNKDTGQVWRQQQQVNESAGSQPAMQANFYGPNFQHQQSGHNCDNQSRELIRQCFLFTNHLLLCTRTKDGKLHPLETIGRISLSEVTLIENPLEFIQQQETIIAHFESIPIQQPQPQLQQQQQQAAEVAKCDASPIQPAHYNQQTLSDGAQEAAGPAELNLARARTSPLAAGSDEQRSIGSRTDRCTGASRGSHVEFDLTRPEPLASRQLETSYATGPKQMRPADGGPGQLPAASSPKRRPKTGIRIETGQQASPRTGIAGYLASKLSNLTHLGGYHHNSSNTVQQQQARASLSNSAPSSPLNKRPAGKQSAAANSAPPTGRPTRNSRRHSSLYSETTAALARTLCRDYAGCDFILLLEPGPKSSSATSAGLAGSGAGGGVGDSSSSGAAAAATNSVGSMSSAAAGSMSSSVFSGAIGWQSGAALATNQPFIIHLVAPNIQEKAAWMSDISQCIDNVHFNDLFHGSVNDSASVTVNQSVRTDPRLYKDDIDIKFSRALNSCKLPQIRYASKERLFERLTDLRFLSIDFLNTFLLTYRVFTTAGDVLEALKNVHYNGDRYYHQQQQQQQQLQLQQQQQHFNQHQAQQVAGQEAVFTHSTFASNAASLSSLNNATIEEQIGMREHQFESNQMISEKSPISATCVQQKPASGGVDDDKSNRTEFQSKQPQQPQQQQQHKPLIPPRSPGVEFNRDKANNETTSKILGPQNLPQHHKRRSTISALTPITGSNSSSVTNLNAVVSFSNSTQPSSLKQSSMVLGKMRGGDNADEMEDNDDDDEQANDFPVDIIYSSSVEHSPVSFTDVLEASMAGQTGASSFADSSVALKLIVPQRRQVRAGSLSQVAGHLMSGSQIAHTSPNTGMGDEHWPLGHKKTPLNHRLGDTGQSLTVSAPSASSRRASSSDIATSVTFTLDPPPVEPRRRRRQLPANSSDAPACELDDTGTQQVGEHLVASCPLVPPSTPIEYDELSQGAADEAAGKANSIESARAGLGDAVRKSSRFMSDSTLAPKMAYNKRQRHRRRRSGRRRLELNPSPAGDEPQLGQASTSGMSLVASVSSSSLSSESQKTTKSVLTSQSESGLIQSSSASVSQRSSSASSASDSSESAQMHKPRSGPANDRWNSSRGRQKAHVGDNVSPAAGSERLRRNFILKGIDLTEAKTIDCDTSADEDKVSTTDSDSEANGSHDGVEAASDSEETGGLQFVGGQNHNQTSGRRRRETNQAGNDDENEDDDEKSFRLLTRLNSVKLDQSYENKMEPNNLTDSEMSDTLISRHSKLEAANLSGGNKLAAAANCDRRASQPVKSVRIDGGQDGASLLASNSRALQSEPMIRTLANEDRSSATQQSSPDSKPSGALRMGPPPLPPPLKVNTARREPTAARPIGRQQAEAGSGPACKTPPHQSGSVPNVIIPPNEQQTRASTGNGKQNVAGQQISSISASSNSRMTTPRSSFQHHSGIESPGERISKAGVIVTSSTPRVSSRRSSTASAASAFAAATAASNNPLLTGQPMMQANCSCMNLHRGSVSSQTTGFSSPQHQQQQQQQQQQLQLHRAAQGAARPMPSGVLQNLASQQLHHLPNCVYFQHQQNSPSNTPLHGYPNALHSDASSLCNSRTSSRLSSCAGLEYGSYSSAQVNFYTMNHMAAPMSMPTKLLGQQQQQQQHRAGLRSNASGAATGSRSKRNSTQINIRSVATIRVLSVLRHWVSKHSQDFVNDTKLSYLAQEFLQDLIMDNSLLPAEHKAALQLQQMVQKAAHSRGAQVDLDLLLAPPSKPSPDSIETLSALEIAEGMTYLDHKIFLAIRSEEFLGQAWMKLDKAIKAPHILLITKRFNDVSRLVSSEIIRVPELHRRVAIIEKWANVAHICRVVHNFNGVLQICAAFTNSSIFRLKKTWEKLSKTTKTTIDQLQTLVSTDSRFRNMRDAINRCDPPSIPYVGMYLTDLSFIEEGTPNYSPDGLLNFSKMRMIAHVIREIQHLQNGSYKIELNHRVANYLLDSSRHLPDEEMYRCSLAIEARTLVGGSGGGGGGWGKNGIHIMHSFSGHYNGNPTNQHHLGHHHHHHRHPSSRHH